MTVCDNCGNILTLDQEGRKRNYCSDFCRTKIYAKEKEERDVTHLIETGREGFLTVSRLRKYGYTVTITKEQKDEYKVAWY